MAEPAPYEVLARRYRSREFGELVGQEAIARTLQNAIASGRTAHAYLFCGTRGVGKTSLARIFAKALNASDGLIEQDAVRTAILQGRDTDVIEIDAASNRGIDNARDLIANAGTAPMRGPYRIYIIDEVHMLTPQAFNALLKTMEEPPRHVKFILCTTEPHQVPATIQSRCQRFDFRAIPASRIAAHLATVLEGEGIAAEPEVLQRIARMANGSMRDALSLLDRLASGAEGALTAVQLEELFGLPDDTVVDALLGAIGEGRGGDALRHASELVDRGLSAERLLDSIAERLREILVGVACGVESDLLDASASRREALGALLPQFDEARAAALIALCDATSRTVRSSSAPRALLDAVLVRMSLSERFADAAGLLAGRAALPGPARPVGSDPKAGAPQRGASNADRSVKIAPPPAGPAPSPAPIAPARAPRAAVATTAPATLVEPSEPLPRQRGVEGGSAPSGAEAPADLDTLWSKVEAAASSPRLAAMLGTVAPESFDGRRLVLRAIGPAGAAKWIADRPEPLQQLLEQVLGPAGRSVRIELADSVESEVAATPRSAAAAASKAASHPIVRMAIDLFDGQILRAGPRTAVPLASAGDGDS